ncbi:MAG: hypothetical protein IPK82_06870 [Polyangiaceae bacterium]|nr:hypothetical protein [Polyangiaceae bacterium]
MPVTDTATGAVKETKRARSSRGSKDRERAERIRDHHAHELRSAWLAEEGTRTSKAAATALERFNHGRALAAAAARADDFVAKSLALRSEGPAGEGVRLDPEKLREIAEHFRREPIDFVPVTPQDWGPEPVILESPATLSVGEEATVTGIDFGTNGTMWLKIGEHRFDVKALQWSNNAVRFVIPQTTQGIALHSVGRLWLRREDNGERDAVGVNVVPRVSVVGFRKLVEEHGTNALTQDYLKAFELSSAPVPIGSEPWSYEDRVFSDTEGSYMVSRAAVILSFWSAYGVWPFDDAAKCAIVEGPTTDPNTRVRSLRVTVSDDYHWDFSLCADFFMVVPLGFSIPPEWHVNIPNTVP